MKRINSIPLCKNNIIRRCNILDIIPKLKIDCMIDMFSDCLYINSERMGISIYSATKKSLNNNS